MILNNFNFTGGYFNSFVNPATGDFTLVVNKISRDHASCTRPPLPDFEVESESITLILPPEQAESLGQKNDSGFKRIELQVYSSLEAVGLTAAISQCLKENNISANVVAGFHHDHVFVPEADAKKAIDALNTLTSQQV